MANEHFAVPAPFSSGTDRALSRLTVGLYLCISLTMLLVLGMAIWGVIHNVNQVRETFVNSEMQRLRSHAERTVVGIQLVIDP